MIVIIIDDDKIQFHAEHSSAVFRFITGEFGHYESFHILPLSPISQVIRPALSGCLFPPERRKYIGQAN